MRSIVVWFNGDKAPNLYLIETEKLIPYYEARDKYINTDGCEDKECNLLEHLAWMLGEETYYGEKIPSLETWLAEARKKEESAVSHEVEKFYGKEAFPKAPAPWAECKLTTPYELSMYINNIFPCGWYM